MAKVMRRVLGEHRAAMLNLCPARHGFAPALALFALFVFVIGCAGEASEPVAQLKQAITISEEQCAPGRPCGIAVVVPAEVGFGQVWLAASDRVTIGSGSTVTGGWVTSAGDSPSGVSLGATSSVEKVMSRGQVALAENARITSALVSPYTPTAAVGASYPASWKKKPVDNDSRSWVFAYPPVGSPSLNITAPTVVSPGSYTEIRASSDITFRPGQYNVRDLVLNTGATIGFTRGGKIELNVASAFTFHASVGTILEGFVVSYAGTAPIAIDGSFKGTLIAPRATVTLRGAPATYALSLFARNVVVEGGARITLTPGQLSAAPPEKCAASLQPDATLPLEQRQRQLEYDLLRFCDAPDLSSCKMQLMGAINADRAIAARRYVSKTIGTQQHLAILRDRTRKANRLRADATRLAAYCQGDADGDFVPDAEDQCPNTPYLTTTNDVGCTTTALPRAPARELVDAVLATRGILTDNRCNSSVAAPPTPRPVGFGALHGGPGGGTNPTLVFAGPLPASSSGCELFYEIDATVIPASGPKQRFHYAVWSRKAVPSLGNDGIPRHRFPLVGPGATSEEVALGAAAAAGSKVYVRARAVDGNGRESSWSAVAFLIAT